MATYADPIYWGSGEDGRKLKEKLSMELKRQNKSLSAFVRELVERELEKLELKGD
jgi:hypothetical protein